MKIVVIGAGALGAYFGARWEQAGLDVTFLVRERRANQLRDIGIHIKSMKGHYAIRSPKVVKDASEIDSTDLVLLAVKGYHLDGTLNQLKTLTSKGAKVVPVLNGIEHISILQKQLGEEAVLGGLSSIISTLDENGDVIHSSPFHDFRFGILHPLQKDVCHELQCLSQNANMNACLEDDILLAMWNKYMFITAFSGITTATNLAIGEIQKHPSTFKIAKELLDDMRKLANANNIPLTDQHVSKTIENLKNLADATTSSMHQDRRKGQKLEVEHIHGGALRLAEKSSIRLPYVEAVYGMIKPFEAN